MKRRAASKPVRSRSRKRESLAGAKRQAALAEAKLRKALATHKIAQVNRFTRDWRSRRISANAATIPDGPITLGRVRQLIRDDAYAASALRSFERNVVGRGITITSTTKGADGVTPDERWKAAAGEYWDRWQSDPRLVDLERRRTFVMVLRWCVRELVAAGEAIIVTGKSGARDAKTPGVVLQCIEAEYLDTKLKTHEVQEHDADGKPIKVTRDVVGGVEVDENGAAVAYHFDNQEQDQLAGTKIVKQRIPASRVIHFFDPDRTSQARGFSRFSSVGLRLRHLSEYDSNQLLAARAEACIGFITKLTQANAPFGTPTGDEDSGESESASSSESTEASTAQATGELNPLMLARLNENEDVVPFTPTRPGNLYDPFVRTQLRAIAAGLGIGYEQIARDFTHGTYSAQRQAMLEDHREFRVIQDALIAIVVRPIRTLVITDGVLRGLLSTGDKSFADEPERWLAARYMTDGWPWIDPEKEAAGAKLAVDNGFSTRERECGNRALDWQEINDQLEQEQGAREGSGLALPIALPAPAAPPAPAPDPAASVAAILGTALELKEIRTALAGVAASVARKPALAQDTGLDEFAHALAALRSKRAA